MGIFVAAKRLVHQYGHVVRLLAMGLIVLFFVRNFQTAMTIFFNRESFDSGQVNTLCQRNSEMWNQNAGMIERVCQDPPSNLGLQFDRFLWFLSDGLPVKYSDETIEHYKDHGILYTIDCPGPKYSHAIYTSYLTGQVPNNFKGKPITGDSLIKSMRRSPYFGNLTYVGPEWSFLSVSSRKEERPNLFAHIFETPEPTTERHDHAYPFFFDSLKDRQWFWQEILPMLTRENGSMFAHSAVFDHVQHGIFRYAVGDPKVERLEILSKVIARDLNLLKDWINKNPDYLLILSSDHGTDEVDNGYVLHGNSARKNEGYVLLYNPRLSPFTKRIDIVDVCPTLAKYFRGVDIPADSIGKTNVYWGENYLGYRATSLLQNMLQLRNTAAKRGISINEARVREDVAFDPMATLNLFSLPDDTRTKYYTWQKSVVDRFERTVQSLKDKTYGLSLPPWNKISWHSGIAFALLLFIVVRHNSELFVLVQMRKWKTSALMAFLLLAIYSGLFVNLMFATRKWEGIFSTGSPFIVWQAVLVGVLWFTLSRLAVVAPEIGADSRPATLFGEPTQLLKKLHRRSKLLSSASILLFSSTFIDVSIFALRGLFAAQWKALVKSNPVILTSMYLLLSWWMCSIVDFSPLEFVLRILRRRHYSRSSVSTAITTPNLTTALSVSGTSNVAPMIGMSAIRSFTLSGVDHLALGLLQLLFCAGFDLTSNRDDFAHMFGFYHFHYFYAALLIVCLIHAFYVLFLRFGSLHLLVIPLTTFAFALLQDTPHIRLLLLVFNIQFSNLLLPLWRCIMRLPEQYWADATVQADLMPETSLDPQTPYDGDKSPSRKADAARARSKEASQLWNVAVQALLLLLLNQPFYQFHVGCEERLNIDAHPFAGTVGITAFDVYPGWSAIQMAYEKNFLFFIFLFHLWHILHRDHNDALRFWSPKHRQQSPTQPAQKAASLPSKWWRSDALPTVQSARTMLNRASELMAFILALFSNNTMLCLYGLMVVPAVRWSAFEQTFVYLVLVALFGVWFVVSFLLSRLYALLLHDDKPFLSLWSQKPGQLHSILSGLQPRHDHNV